MILTNKGNYSDSDPKHGLIDPNSIKILLEPKFSLVVEKDYKRSTAHGKLNDVFHAFKELEWRHKQIWDEQVSKLKLLKKELISASPESKKKLKRDEINELRSNQTFVYPLMVLNDNLTIINNNITSPVALATLYGLARMKPYPISGIEKSFAGFSDQFRNSVLGKLVGDVIAKRVELEKNNLSIGTEAPNFSAKNMLSKEIKLDSYRGKYVLVEFWASWCGPCRVEMPFLLQAKEKNKDLVVIAISFDEKIDNWKLAVESDKISSFVNLIDTMGIKSELFNLYKIQYIPQNYLIDKSGKIIAKNIYGKELTSMLVDRYLPD
ncbi:MAG: TlpA family protein disulfide reductase [Pedobacter sp.]|nr:MAG: TlpA family protein disulfide reductase [Pedobacter sp.]